MSHKSVSLFWDKYISKTMAYGVKSDAARWYVRHAESYIKAFPDLKLVQHLAANVKSYFLEKSRSNRLKDWQLKQMVIAVKLLFTNMVEVPWAKDFPWDDWINQCDYLTNAHATVARDYLSRSSREKF